MTVILTRFAPSPTGLLHLGHAASAFAVWDWAAANGADVLLRIEDIDQTRCRAAFDMAILEDLSWLGLQWTGQVRRQSAHFDAYSHALDRLIARGLVYRCFLTRSELVSTAPAPLAAVEEQRRLDRGDAFAWRLNLKMALRQIAADGGGAAGFFNAGTWIPATPEILGDVVLARKDTPTSYHLACCHDDALQGVTHIIRGMDLWDSTHIHAVLQRLLGWSTPRYTHHALLTDTQGNKLAKRKGSKALRDYRNEGVTPADIRAMTGFR